MQLGEIMKVMNDKIVIKYNKYRIIININDIVYCQAKSNYTDLFLTNLENSTISCAKTLKKIEDILPENHFIRCHRSYLANINHIDYFEVNGKKIIMKNKKTIKLSESGFKKIKKLLNY